MVAGRSSVYWHAPYEAGLWFAGIASCSRRSGRSLANGDWPVWHIGCTCAITVGGFLTGFFATRVINIERFFADRAIMRAECEERAHRLFSEYGLFRTTARTGVLVYVSLFEHVVIVLGDSGISAKIGPNEYTTIVDAMIKRIQAGQARTGADRGHRDARHPPDRELPALGRRRERAPRPPLRAAVAERGRQTRSGCARPGLSLGEAGLGLSASAISVFPLV